MNCGELTKGTVYMYIIKYAVRDYLQQEYTLAPNNSQDTIIVAGSLEFLFPLRETCTKLRNKPKKKKKGNLFHFEAP